MERLYLATNLEPKSLENRLKDLKFRDDFLNSPHKITDIRIEDKKTFFAASINVFFKKDENKIIFSEPKSEGEILNIFHSIGMYYEMIFKENIQDGKVAEDFKIYDINGNEQKINPPKIELTDKPFEVNDEIILDCPERVFSPGMVGGRADEENIKEIFIGINMESFNYTSGTDFIVLNKLKDPLKKVIEDFSNALPVKSAQLIKYIIKKNEKPAINRPEENSDSNLRLLQYFPLQEKIKLIKKHHQICLKDNSDEKRYSSLEELLVERSLKNDLIKKEYLKTLIATEKPISNVGDYFNEVFINKLKVGETKYGDIANDIKEFYHKEIAKRNSELNLSEYLDGKIDEKTKDFCFELIKKYGGLEFENKIKESGKEFENFVLKNSLTFIKNPKIINYIFDHFPNRKDIIEENKTAFEKYLLEKAKEDYCKCQSPAPLIPEWEEYFPDLRKVIGEEKFQENIKNSLECFKGFLSQDREILKDASYWGHSANAHHFSLYKKLKFKKIKEKLLREANGNFHTSENFTREEIIKEMENKSYFAVPTFIKGFSNKQYKRFNQQLKEFKVPSINLGNLTLVYDTRRSHLYRETMPEKIRREFGINRLSGDKQRIMQRFYKGFKNAGNFQDLTKYLK